METAKNDKNEIMVNCVNKKLVAAIKKTEDGNTKTHRTRTRAA